MAAQYYGVGISYKFKDGTMIWIVQETWGEVIKEVDAALGPEAVFRLNDMLAEVWGGGAPPETNVAQFPSPTVGQEAAPTATTAETAYETCPRCGKQKDRWVPPGTSQKTGRQYPGFYGCPTPGCPGR